MANTYLTRTQVAGNRQIFTQSIWFKLTNTADQVFISSYNDANNYNCFFLESGNQVLQVLWKKSGSNAALLNTTRKFRDTSAWYHVVLAVDTTQGTAANRIKLYVNGVQETSFSTATYPNQNESIEVNDNNTNQRIGALNTDTFFQGVASYVAQIDGTQELPGIFGETDSTTGEWKIKTDITPSVAWGNNGFLILKNGNSLTDESSNSNNFTLGGGTLTETKDCPDNVFCVLNDLDTTRVLSNGNTTYAGDASGTVVKGTLGMLSGKYYAECKILSAAQNMIGVLSIAQAPTTVFVGASAVGWGLFGDGTLYNNSSATSNFSNSFSDNDIMGIALDMDNNKLYFSKNGVWQNSGDPTSGATGTGAVSITSGLTMTFSGGRDSSSDTANFNFGNGTFGTTAVASAGTNASNNGVFEYDTPTGYTALSTKGLNL